MTTQSLQVPDHCQATQPSYLLVSCGVFGWPKPKLETKLEISGPSLKQGRVLAMLCQSGRPISDGRAIVPSGVWVCGSIADVA